VCIPVFADFTAQQMLASLDGIGRRQLRMSHIAEAFVQRVFFKQTEKKKKEQEILFSFYWAFRLLGLCEFRFFPVALLAYTFSKVRGYVCFLYSHLDSIDRVRFVRVALVFRSASDSFPFSFTSD
jgi:hypothetical protein